MFSSNYSSPQLKESVCLSACLSFKIGLQNPGTGWRAAQVHGLEPGTANGERGGKVNFLYFEELALWSSGKHEYCM